jgi:type II secretory pathway predicted ATPase ExeA
MYESFYGFKERPFALLPDPDFLFLNENHRAALAMLEKAVSDRSGFCVISGEIGAGKTTLVRELLNRLDATVCVGLVSNTHPSFGELLHWVIAAYGLPIGDGDTLELHKQFVEFVTQQHSQNKHTLLIIDEAQNLTVQALEELRMLSSVNSDKDLILQVILVGQHQLRDKLQQPELEQFSQRIALNYHLEALSQDETCGYIQHRVSHAGGETGLFSAEACQLVYKLSGGIPRLINRFCDLSLVYGCTEESRVITAELVGRVGEDQRMSSLREIPQVNLVSAEPDETVQPVEASEEQKAEPGSSNAPVTGEQPEDAGISPGQMEEADSTPSNTIVGELNPALVQETNTAASRKEIVSETDVASELQQMAVIAEAHKKRVRSERRALWLLVGVIVMAGGAGWLIGDYQSASQVDAFKEQAVSATTTLPPVVTKEVAVTPPASAVSQAGEPDASSPEEKDGPQLSAADSAEPMENGAVKDAEAEQMSLQKVEEERMAQQRAAELKREAEAISLQKAQEESVAQQRAAALKREAEEISLQKAEEERMAQQRAAELKREVEETARLKKEFDRMEGERRAEEQKLAKQRAARKKLERKLSLERKKLAEAREAGKKLAEERAPAEADLSEVPLAKSLPREPKRPGKAPASFKQTVPSAYDEDDGDAIVRETKARITGAVSGFQNTLPAAYAEDDGDAIVRETKASIVGRPVTESAK